jgi:ABC-type bacteriocin/lantibiotic exporter with double-glycine peptidase domain
MARFAGVLFGLLAGCSTYLGTAEEWDPRTAGREFILISGLSPVRQADSTGCGPAALAMVLRYHGDPIGDDVLPADDQGVAARALRDLARSRGFNAHLIEGSFEDLEEHLRKGRPLIVGLVKPFLSGAKPHYEVVAGIDPVRGTVATVDPARGWTVNSEEGFLEEWGRSGRLMLIVAREQK